MRRKAPVHGWRVQRLGAEKWRTFAVVQRRNTKRDLHHLLEFMIVLATGS